MVRDSEMNGRKIYVIKFTDVEMEELMNKSIIDKPNAKILQVKKPSVKKRRSCEFILERNFSTKHQR